MKEYINQLPYEGEVYYIPNFLPPSEAMACFRQLREQIAWEHDRVRMFGKEIITRRQVAWYGDLPYTYKYSGHSRTALPFTPLLDELRSRAAKVADQAFNSCLLNLYHEGSEGMSWHRDNEPELLPQGCIASYSLGAERKFVFRHRKTKAKQEVFLEDGSLLLMRGSVQEHWEHRLPPTKKVSSPRINLTFRYIREIPGK